jgi:hypothetical protein
MTNANYTMSVLNGVSDEARNMVLVVGGTNSAIYQVIAPLVPKVYTVFNNTSGGYAISIGGTSGTVVNIPNGVATSVYCDGSNFYSGNTGTIGNYSINGNANVTGTLSVTGATTFVGIPSGPTASPGTSTTQLATTAFVTNVASTLGTMATQNANAVAITGGVISGMTSIADTVGNVRTLPIENKTSGYTLTTADNGQVVSITAGGVTVPSGVMTVGQVVTIFNNSSSSQTITQGSGVTMYLAGVGTTGNRTLGLYGVCTVLCVASNTFVAAGSGVS